MEPAAARFEFPQAFCCNCGAAECSQELQDTRVTRYFGVGGVETTFQLGIPICAACRKTTRRRPPTLFRRLLIFALVLAVIFLAWLALASVVMLPAWLADQVFLASAACAVLVCVLSWRLRQPKPPQTSYFQPVRIEAVNVEVTDVMTGAGRVAHIVFSFTNPAYLEAFRGANQEAIAAKFLAARKA
jgi:hypothetical protein